MNNSQLQWVLQPLVAVSRTLFPRRCPACQAFISGESILCAQCQSSLWPLSTPLCARCGIPFQEHAAHRLCGPCFSAPPRYDQARASFLHGAAIRDAIYRFKFGPAPGIGANALVELCRSHGFPPPKPTVGSVVIPVPLHPRKLRKRTFNQAALLAKALVRDSRGSRFSTTLRRIRQTANQQALSPRGRRKNVEGAFKVTCAEEIQGRDVLLVDDILTTGATADACAVALRRAGARRIDVWSVSRVPAVVFVHQGTGPSIQT